MTQAFAVTQYFCPSCNAVLGGEAQGSVVCPSCSWKGSVYLFARLPIQTEAAELALPDDATCIHHTRKKATATCAGTGDYICSLCAVELNGQTYSAQYISAAGKEKLGKAFERYLPRPDSQIRAYILSIFIPYVDFVTIPFAFVWIPHAFFLYAKALRMRQTDPLFRRLMGRSGVVVYPILLALAALGWCGMVIAIIYAVTSR